MEGKYGNKREASVFKGQIDKVTDKIVCGVNKETNTINLTYIDNKQINFTMILPNGTEQIDQKLLELRCSDIIKEQLGIYRKQDKQELHKQLIKVKEEAFAASMIATSGASIAINSVYMTTGNKADIKVSPIKFI